MNFKVVFKWLTNPKNLFMPNVIEEVNDLMLAKMLGNEPSMLFSFNAEIKMELTVYLFASFDYGNLFGCDSFSCNIIPMIFHDKDFSKVLLRIHLPCLLPTLNTNRTLKTTIHKNKCSSVL